MLLNRDRMETVASLGFPPPWAAALVLLAIALTTMLAGGCSGGGGDGGGAGAVDPAPHVKLIQPGDGETDVARNAMLTITFSDPMEPASTEAALQITPATPGSISWNGDGSELQFAPDALLNGFGTYSVAVMDTAQAMSGAGIAEPVGVSFQVEDDVPPMIDQTLPESGEDLVAVNLSVSIRFSEPMDPLTTAAAISFSPAATGTISFNADNTVLTFTPDANYAAFTTYVVTVGADATDPGGTPLYGTASFQFTTDDHQL